MNHSLLCVRSRSGPFHFYLDKQKMEYAYLIDRLIDHELCPVLMHQCITKEGVSDAAYNTW